MITCKAKVTVLRVEQDVVSFEGFHSMQEMLLHYLSASSFDRLPYGSVKHVEALEVLHGVLTRVIQKAKIDPEFGTY